MKSSSRRGPPWDNSGPPRSSCRELMAAMMVATAGSSSDSSSSSSRGGARSRGRSGKIKRTSAKRLGIIDASVALAESKRNRLAGMSCSPNAISSRNDIQVAFQMLFNDKTEEQMRLESTWAAGRMDADQSGDAVDMLRRKMRASIVKSGVTTDDWETAFQQFDRDNSGELECQEFVKAVRKTVGITKAMIDDECLVRLFRQIDDDHSGSISASELKDFIRWRPKQKKKSRDSLTPLSPLSPITQNASFGQLPPSVLQNFSNATFEPTPAQEGAPTVAEYICVRRAVLRETPDLSSSKVGVLSVGETVAVVRSVGVRLKCIRLRWGTELRNGWATRETEWGEPLLEKLPRVEWSAVSNNDTAIAHRVASLNDAKSIIATKNKHLRHRSGWDLWAIVRNHVKASEKTFADTSKIRLDIKTKPVSRKLAQPQQNLTPRRKKAAATVLSCESLEEVSMLLDTLESRSKELWPSEIEDWTRKEKVVEPMRSHTHVSENDDTATASDMNGSLASTKSDRTHRYTAIDRVLRSHRRRNGRVRSTRSIDVPGKSLDDGTTAHGFSCAHDAGRGIRAMQKRTLRVPKHLPPTAENAAKLTDRLTEAASASPQAAEPLGSDAPPAMVSPRFAATTVARNVAEAVKAPAVAPQNEGEREQSNADAPTEKTSVTARTIAEAVVTPAVALKAKQRTAQSNVGVDVGVDAETQNSSAPAGKVAEVVVAPAVAPQAEQAEDQVNLDVDAVCQSHESWPMTPVQPPEKVDVSQ